jgi:hypothetical protein
MKGLERKQDLKEGKGSGTESCWNKPEEDREREKYDGW